MSDSATLRCVCEGQGASCEVEQLFVGDDTISRQAVGKLEILDGGLVKGRALVSIGSISSGQCLVRGSNQPSRLDANEVAVGDNANGVLRVEANGVVTSRTLSINGLVDGDGRLVVDGQGQRADVTVAERFAVSDASGSGDEVQIINGGKVTAGSVTLGDGPSRAPGSFIFATVASNSAAESKLHVTEVLGSTVSMIVGQQGTAHLSVLNGGFVELAGGLAINAFGSVTVANRQSNGQLGGAGRRATLKALGPAVLVGAESPGDLFVESGGSFEAGCPVAVGLVSQGSDDSRLVLKGPGASELKLDGESLSIGVNSSGRLSMNDESTATCRVLVVGGQATPGDGNVTLENGSRISVAELVQIGAAESSASGGTGSVLVGDGCSLLNDGRLIVGGAAPGTLTMINPTRSIVRASGGTRVEQNGRIAGSGFLNSNVEVAAQGLIDPGINVSGTTTVAPKMRHKPTFQSLESPIGELTVDGNYQQRAAGVLVIEIAGTEPGQFDVLHVTGDATLAGTVELSFIDGFVPERGFAVDFVVVDGSVTGKLTGNNRIDLSGGNITDGTANTIAVAEVEWETTSQGTCRMTVTNVTALNDSGRLLPPACGAGLCGVGIAPMLPLTLLGLNLMRRRLRISNLRSVTRNS